jgi:hypothetical protein
LAALGAQTLIVHLQLVMAKMKREMFRPWSALTALSERARLGPVPQGCGDERRIRKLFMRSLLSDGRIRRETVEKTSEGMVPRLIERGCPQAECDRLLLSRLGPQEPALQVSTFSSI